MSNLNLSGNDLLDYMRVNGGSITLQFGDNFDAKLCFELEKLTSTEKIRLSEKTKEIATYTLGWWDKPIYGTEQTPHFFVFLFDYDGVEDIRGKLINTTTDGKYDIIFRNKQGEPVLRRFRREEIHFWVTTKRSEEIKKLS